MSDDGELGTYKTKEIFLKNLTLNGEISDDLFTISFPDGIEIIDNLQGFGREPKLSDSFKAVDTTRESPSWWKSLLLMNLVLFSVLAAGYALYRRRQHTNA